MTRAISPATAAILLVIAPPALAHHPMGGATPTTFWHGLLSGLGHPILGPDHLMFVLALGVTAAFAAPGLLIPAAFIAATMAGVLVHAAGFDIPLAEALVGATLMVLGAVFLTGRTFTSPVWLVFSALAGIVHGYAFGETIVGADRGVIGAYLAGLAVVQFATCRRHGGLCARVRSGGRLCSPSHESGRRRSDGDRVAFRVVGVELSVSLRGWS